MPKSGDVDVSNEAFGQWLQDKPEATMKMALLLLFDRVARTSFGEAYADKLSDQFLSETVNRKLDEYRVRPPV